jgi:putative chitinase
MQLSEHFALAEFTRSAKADELKIDNTPTPEHLANLKVTASCLEAVRTRFGNHPLVISSGYRNPTLNKAIGGVPDSDHALGWAADFGIPAFGDPFTVAKSIEASALWFDQLIHERRPGEWWVHLSFNPRRRGQLLTLSGINPNRYSPGIFMPPVFIKPAR